MVNRLGLRSRKHMRANIEHHHRALYIQAQVDSNALSHHTPGSTHSIVSGVDTDSTT